MLHGKLTIENSKIESFLEVLSKKRSKKEFDNYIKFVNGEIPIESVHPAKYQHTDKDISHGTKQI